MRKLFEYVMKLWLIFLLMRHGFRKAFGKSRYLIEDQERPTEKKVPWGPSCELIEFRPARLQEEDILGREVLEYTANFGTYGMGGLGYFGMRIGKEEWLVIAIFGADDWLSAMNRPLTWDSVPGDEKDDTWFRDHRNEFDERLIGQVISSVDILRRSMVIRFENGFDLTIAEDPETRPRNAGNGSLRKFGFWDDLRDSVFLVPADQLWSLD